jgi:hypothetical protein
MTPSCDFNGLPKTIYGLEKVAAGGLSVGKIKLLQNQNRGRLYKTASLEKMVKTLEDLLSQANATQDC